MRVTHVLDTCALVDLVAGRWQNQSAIQELENATHPVVHSLSAWEIARKLRIGKLSLPCETETLSEFLTEVMTHFQLTWYSLDAQNACHAESLPMHHKDPVDRMILSLSISKSIPLFSSDRQFELYDCEWIKHR